MGFWVAKMSSGCLKEFCALWWAGMPTLQPRRWRGGGSKTHPTSQALRLGGGLGSPPYNRFGGLTNPPYAGF
ncbi:MAG: hypothetical protein IKZ88_08740 [Neisseriaceae bacterium]|nr:hypothetical protein [Neisseriaceae bacterium]